MRIPSSDGISFLQEQGWMSLSRCVLRVAGRRGRRGLAFALLYRRARRVRRADPVLGERCFRQPARRRHGGLRGGARFGGAAWRAVGLLVCGYHRRAPYILSCRVSISLSVVSRARTGAFLLVDPARRPVHFFALRAHLTAG